jgi:hypothetical protein
MFNDITGDGDAEPLGNLLGGGVVAYLFSALALQRYSRFGEDH